MNMKQTLTGIILGTALTIAGCTRTESAIPHPLPLVTYQDYEAQTGEKQGPRTLHIYRKQAVDYDSYGMRHHFGDGRLLLSIQENPETHQFEWVTYHADKKRLSDDEASKICDPHFLENMYKHVIEIDGIRGKLLAH